MAFSVALSGLKSASTQLEITGNNISNVAVTGFKKSYGDFVDVYSTGGGFVDASGGQGAVGKGSRLAAVKQSFSQGSVNASDGGLDMAINGSGFFIVSRGGTNTYTRAGSFGLDSSGYVVNSLGGKLQGYQADSTGVVSGALGDIRISAATIPPVATSTFSSVLNLNSSASVPTVAWAGTASFGGTAPAAATYNNATSTTVYDSLGNPHVLSAYFIKASSSSVSNVWNAHFQIDGVNVSTNASKANALTSTASTLVASGSLPTISTGDLTINGSSVAAPVSDGVSTSQPNSSARSIATAINAASISGITASADVNTLNLGTYTPGTLSGTQFQINGQNIVVASATSGALITAINAVTGTTGVSAAVNSSNNIVLTAMFSSLFA
jgi:flagellar hook protein FlgE